MRRIRQPCVYILASKRNGTLYIGVTADLMAHAAPNATAVGTSQNPFAEMWKILATAS